MNKQTLMMKYHPAKKEIEFHRFQNGKEIPIRSDSNLRTRYMNKKENSFYKIMVMSFLTI